jgi:hypothetical protein
MLALVGAFIFIGAWAEYSDLVKDMDAEEELRKNDSIEDKTLNVATAAMLLRMAWASCRDFLHDAAWVERHGKDKANDALCSMVELENSISQKGNVMARMTTAVLAIRRLDINDDMDFATASVGRALADLNPELSRGFSEAGIECDNPSLLRNRKVMKKTLDFFNDERSGAGAKDPQPA